MRTGVTRRTLLVSAGTTATAAATGAIPAASAQVDGEWPMFGFDAANSGYAPDETGPRRDVGGAWRVDLGRGVSSSPAVVDGTIYVGSDDTSLHALSAEDGSEGWAFDTGDRVTSSPAVVDGTVYVGSNDGSVYAVDAADGTEQWTFETGGQVVSSPTVVDGTVYIGSRDSSLYAIDAGEGTEEWAFEAADDVSGTPVVADGTVYAGSEDGNLYAVEAAEGTEEWAFQTNREITSGPTATADGGTVFVGNLDGNLFAVDTESEELRWGFTAEGPIVATPALDDETLYVGSRDGRVYALARVSGEEIWSVDTGLQVVGSPSVAGSVVYVGNQGRSLFGLLTTDGSRLWQYDTPGTITSSPAVVDGTVFVGAGDGAFYAFREGARLPTTDTPTPAGGDDSGSSILTPLALPATIVGFVAFLLGTGYVAYRAGLFKPIETAAPDPPSDDEGADTEGDGEDAGPGKFPLMNAVIGDVIARAEDSKRMASDDILVTKHVDPDTLDAPMVAYEIESLWSEPVEILISESLAGAGIPDEAIGRLGEGWRVEDERLYFETTLDPDETVRTVVARNDLSPEDAEALLSRPALSVLPQGED